MDITISATTPDIIIHPPDLATEVVQNVRMILTTIKGTLPLDRDFGLSADIIDQPIDRAQAMIIRDVYEQLRACEPRAEIIRVFFQGNDADAADGRLLPTVTLRIREDA